MGLTMSGQPPPTSSSDAPARVFIRCAPVPLRARPWSGFADLDGSMHLLMRTNPRHERTLQLCRRERICLKTARPDYVMRFHAAMQNL
jgi:hypothetical protein